MEVTSMGEGDGMAYQDGFKQNFTGLDPLAALRKPTICYASPSFDVEEAFVKPNINSMAGKDGLLWADSYQGRER
jgi:hypothetical protein